VVTELDDAYAACERLARSHYENFPVASRLLPARMRSHVAAVYAFARIADDFADEGSLAPDARLAALAHWGRRLDAALAGRDDPAEPNAYVFVAARHSIETCRLPVQLFHDLLSAFSQDVTTKRYPAWGGVLDYCRRSANPVGRLVLRIAGYDRAELDRASDFLCTALQLTNFWQDLEIDWQKGRLYVPEEVWKPMGASMDDLSARRLSPEWKRALAEVTARTRALFADGKRVCDGVRGRLRYELRATWLGGNRILDKLEAANFDVFRHRPTLAASDLPILVWQTITRR
jgi:squalene synthase HpnC